MDEVELRVKMPVLFLAHGSPMNAITQNDFTEALRSLGPRLPKPKAILCISAHWLTEGIWVTHMSRPRTIHDFYGFPKELFDVQYPAPGDPELAEKISQEIQRPVIHKDDSEWGLDHGAWSVLKFLYPNADVPIVQLSLDPQKPGDFYFSLGEQLAKFREEGILIVGSGNIVHNLRRMERDPFASPYPWANEFDQWVKKKIEERDFKELISGYLKLEAGRLSVPTPDHYLPLLYILGASTESDQVRFEYEGIQNASVSMRCISFGMNP